MLANCQLRRNTEPFVAGGACREMLHFTGINRYRHTLPHTTLRSIEGVAGASCCEGAIRTAGQFDQGLANANDLRCLLALRRTLTGSTSGWRPLRLPPDARLVRDG